MMRHPFLQKRLTYEHIKERLQEAERARLAKGCEAHMSMSTYLKGRLVMWIPALCRLLSFTPKESANPRNGRPRDREVENFHV